MESTTARQKIEALSPENVDELKHFIREEATDAEIAEYINYHWSAMEDDPRMVKKVFAMLKGRRRSGFSNGWSSKFSVSCSIYFPGKGSLTCSTGFPRMTELHFLKKCLSR